MFRHAWVGLIQPESDHRWYVRIRLLSLFFCLQKQRVVNAMSLSSKDTGSCIRHLDLVVKLKLLVITGSIVW